MRFWIGLGSNLGDRLGLLRSAADAFQSVGTVVARSRVYAASAMGGPPQPSFLNAALILDAELEPAQVLLACQEVETAHGRARAVEAVRWGPRTLDADILMAGARGELVIALPELVVPHPRMAERAFALAPLVELDATLVHPTEARPLKTLLHAAQSRGHVVAPTGDPL